MNSQKYTPILLANESVSFSHQGRDCEIIISAHQIHRDQILVLGRVIVDGKLEWREQSLTSDYKYQENLYLELVKQANDIAFESILN